MIAQRDPPDHPILLADAMRVKETGKFLGLLIRRHRRRQAHAKAYHARELDSLPGARPRSLAAMLVMALWRRGKPQELLHHSDQGSQYTSEQFQRLLTEQGITCSMSRQGDVWDNAAMESFFSSLKTERVNGKVYSTRNQARADVFDYVERFYNARRRHSTIGFISPAEYENAVE